MPRLIAAILLTPLLLHLPMLLLQPRQTYARWWFDIEVALTYVGMALFGLPLIVLFVRRRWTRWWQVALGGMAAAGLLVALYFGMTHWDHFVLNGVRLALYGLVMGAVAGWMFWVLAFWGNPRFAATRAARESRSRGGRLT